MHAPRNSSIRKKCPPINEARLRSVEQILNPDVEPAHAQTHRTLECRPFSEIPAEPGYETPRYPDGTRMVAPAWKAYRRTVQRLGNRVPPGLWARLQAEQFAAERLLAEKLRP